MTAEQFAYWLQGFVELNPSMEQPTPEQWKAICEHLQTVFVKVTPPVEAPPRPLVAAPARNRSTQDILQDAIRELELRRPTPYVGPPLIGPGITITC